MTALVTHAKGKIKYYEVWNEFTDINFFSGLPHNLRLLLSMLTTSSIPSIPTRS